MTQSRARCSLVVAEYNLWCRVAASSRTCEVEEMEGYLRLTLETGTDGKVVQGVEGQ